MAAMNLGVTLHSFGMEYYTYRYTMEDCIAAVGSLAPGAGVELVAPQMIRGFPDLPAEFEHRFRRAVDRYGVTPTAYGGYGDAQRGEGAWAPRSEQLDYLQRQIRAARRLGFPLIRVQPSEVVLGELVPFAEKHDVRMVIEIHSPMSIETIDPLIERVEAVGSPYLGFAPDLGMFSRTVADVAVNGYISRGVPREIADLVVQRWHESTPEAAVVAEVRPPAVTSSPSSSRASPRCSGVIPSPRLCTGCSRSSVTCTASSITPMPTAWTPPCDSPR